MTFIHEFMSRRSLVQKILVPVLVISTILLGAFGGLVLSQRTEAVETALTSKAEAMADYMAKTSSSYFANYDLSALREFADFAVKDKDIDAVTFFDKNDKPVSGDAKPLGKGVRSLERPIVDANGGALGRVRVAYKMDRINDAATKTVVLVLLGILLVEVVLGVAVGLVVRGVARSLGAVGGDLTASSQVLFSTSDSLQRSGETLATTFREQAAAIQETVSTLDEINATAATSRQEAVKSAEAAKRSEATAVQMKDAIANLVRAIGEISSSNDVIMNEVENGNREINKIVEIIREIDNKTKVINDIVFQTKLLSFNASVEAARAGEHGKGFAVVAEEVGNLAQMSGAAAKEISAMLDDSMRKVETVVKGMESKIGSLITLGKSKVENGSRVAHSCGESLGAIVEQVTQLSRMVSNIAHAFDEQAKGVGGISTAMSQLDRSTSSNLQKVDESVGISQELLSQARQLGQVIETLQANLSGHANAALAHAHAPSHAAAHEKHPTPIDGGRRAA